MTEGWASESIPNITHNDEVNCVTGTGHELLVYAGPRAQLPFVQAGNKKICNHVGKPDLGTPRRKSVRKKSVSIMGLDKLMKGT